VVAVIVILVVVLLVLLAGVVSYNRFVSGRVSVQNAWADVDTELKRRYDLVPNLVNTVQGYAAHERGVFEEVARTRSAAQAAQGPAEQSAAEGPFVQALGRLFARAEGKPKLSAAAGDSLRHRRPHPVRAPRVQRVRAAIQPPRAGVSVEPHRTVVPLPERRLLQHS